jgi:hypothetical protein
MFSQGVEAQVYEGEQKQYKHEDSQFFVTSQKIQTSQNFFFEQSLSRDISDHYVLLTVKTPFQYRFPSSPNKNKNLRVDCTPNSEITPYEIFCLRSILITKLERALGIPITVKFLRIFVDSQDIYIKVLTPERKNKLVIQQTTDKTKAFKIMKDIVNSVILGPRDFCILFRHDINLEIDEFNSKPIHVPQHWLTDMLSFIVKDVLKGYDYKLCNGDIYIRLDESKFQNTRIDYLTEYENLQSLLLKHIRRLFRKGTLKLSKDQTDFARKWFLKKVCELDTGDEIYQAQWFDKRFFNEISGENMTKFLLNRLKKDYIFIPDIEFSSTQYKTEIIDPAIKEELDEFESNKKYEQKKKTRKVQKGTKVYIDNLEDLWHLYGHLRHVEKNVYN